MKTITFTTITLLTSFFFVACNAVSYYSGGLTTPATAAITISEADVETPSDPEAVPFITVSLLHQQEISHGIDSLKEAYEATSFDVNKIQAKPFHFATAAETNFAGIDSLQVFLKSTDGTERVDLLGKFTSPLELAAFDSHSIAIDHEADFALLMGADYGYELELVVFPNEFFKELNFDASWAWNVAYDAAKE